MTLCHQVLGLEVDRRQTVTKRNETVRCYRNPKHSKNLVLHRVFRLNCISDSGASLPLSVNCATGESWLNSQHKKKHFSLSLYLYLCSFQTDFVAHSASCLI